MDDLDLGATIKGFIPGQKLFNRYTLTRILGRGGMGVVWLARDEELERDVALKFLPEVVALDKEAIRDLKRETRRSLELTHPHIVRIYDFIQDPRTAAISMEYVAGETLATKKVDQPNGHFEVAALREWVRQWLEAMEYAHAEAKVAHRDLKPANLMIDGQGRLKVADFGIAASMGETASRVSNQFGSSGTPVYMSPQQMMGERPAVTDDIYAIGATLYELLTGKPPFYSGNVLMQVQNKVPPTITQRRTELGLPAIGSATAGVTGDPIPSEWEATIAACLAKEPQDRPQSAGEVLERLRMGEGGLRSAPAQSRKVTTDAADKTDKAERVISNATSTVAEQSKIPNPKPAHRSFGEGGSKIVAVAGLAVGMALIVGAWWFLRAGDSDKVVPPQALPIATPADPAPSAEEQAAETRAAEEKRAQEVILARLSQFEVSAAREVRDDVERAVESYLATAPVERREAVRAYWEQSKSAWQRHFDAHAPGALVITTQPAGAELTVGDVTRRSPARFENLTPGPVRVAARLEGYEDAAFELQVQAGRTVEVPPLTLSRITGKVSLTSVHAGVTVNLESDSGETRRGSLPVTWDDVPVGAYRAVFALPGGEETRTELRVAARQTVRHEPVFRVGRLRVTANAPDAVVTLEGQPSRPAPVEFSELPLGTYRVRVEATDHLPYEEVIVLSDSRERSLTTNLELTPRVRTLRVFQASDWEHRATGLGAGLRVIYRILSDTEIEQQTSGGLVKTRYRGVINEVLGQENAIIITWLEGLGLKGRTYRLQLNGDREFHIREPDGSEVTTLGIKKRSDFHAIPKGSAP